MKRVLRLASLAPRLIRHEDGAANKIAYRPVDSLTEAQGLRFNCPLCPSHAIVCWSSSRGVPAEAVPPPGRWQFCGSGVDDLSLKDGAAGGPRLALLQGGCGWHGRIEAGEVQTI